MIRLFNYSYILTQHICRILQVLLETSDVSILLDLIVWFAEVDLSPQVLNLFMCLVLYSCNLFLFPVPPYRVEVLQQLIHEGL